MNDLRKLEAYCGEDRVFVDNRIRIRGKSNMTLLPDYYMVEVYNMSETDKALLSSRKELRVLTETMAVFISGEVEDIYTTYEGANQVSVISVTDGQSFWETKVSQTVGRGALISTTIRHILKNATMGSYLAKDDRFIRSQAFHGRLADCISSLARGVHARAFISKDVLHVVEEGRSEVIVAVEEEDLVDEPHFADGVCIVKATVKSWPVGMLHEFRGNRYRLVSQSIDADNYQGNWQTELMLVNEVYLDKDGMDGG